MKTKYRNKLTDCSRSFEFFKVYVELVMREVFLKINILFGSRLVKLVTIVEDGRLVQSYRTLRLPHDFLTPFSGPSSPVHFRVSFFCMSVFSVCNFRLYFITVPVD